MGGHSRARAASRSSARGVDATRPSSRGLAWVLAPLAAVLAAVALAAAAGAVVTYEEVSDEVGVTFQQAGEVHPPFTDWPAFPETAGTGACWFDANGDGDVDLYVVNQSYNPENPATDGWIDDVDPRNELYVNQGDGTFEERGEEAGVASDAFGQACSAADYDGDGRVDLYVANFGPNELFRNEGDLSFANVTAQAGVSHGDECGEHRCWSMSSAWADYDGDGDLDLFLTNYVDSNLTDKNRGPGPHVAQFNALFENQGDGTFEEVAEEAGVEGEATEVGGSKSLGAVWFDHDLDGDPDLYVANDGEPNEFYENDGDGTFTDMSEETNLDDDDRHGMGVTAGDPDNDGDMELFFTNFEREDNGFYENTEDTAWTDRSGEDDLSTARKFVGWGTRFHDRDRDQDLDLLVANGHTRVTEQARQKELVYDQRPGDGGELEWVDVTDDALAGSIEARTSRGAAFADYDEDGDTDVVVVNNRNKSLQFLEASNQTNHWLGIRLEQSGENVYGIGARVNVTTEDLVQRREVRAGSSYLSQNDRTAQFGLADDATADEVRVHWPDGNITVVEDVAADQVFVVDREEHGTINLEPDASYANTPETPEDGETVRFTDTSRDVDGEVVGWNWTFGDGHTSTAQHPTHSFAEPGNYSVTLNVTDDEGGHDETTRTVRVYDDRPHASFTVSSNPVVSLDTVRFEDTSTTDGAPIESRSWALDDGATATGPEVEHAFQAPGTYEVTLTVEAEDGSKGRATRELVVENRPPEPAMRPAEQPFVAGEAAVLYDASRDLDGSVEAWSWDLGDGTSTSQRHALHVYPERGAYEVTLAVRDDAGAWNATTRTVQVVDEPSAPRNLSAAWHPAIGEVRLDWDAPADFGGDDVVYEVYREGLRQGRSLAGTTDNVTELRDRPREPDRYNYTVVAVNAAGAGPSSEVAQAPGVDIPPPAEPVRELAREVDPLAALGLDPPETPR